MDELKFAQFENITKLPCKKRLEILNRIDINYCFQDTSNLTQYTKYYDGSTYLHMAVHNRQTDCVKQLLNQGADLLKQRTVDGRTPLLEAVDRGYEKSSIWHLMGKLKHEMIEILLSAQIKTGNTLNPKDKEEISHFHAACIINHVEAVKFFLEAGEFVNQAISSDKYLLPGYTALNYAIRYSSVEAAEILINHGADVFLKDARGKCSFRLLIERLMDLTDYMTMGKRSCCSFFKAEIERIESIIHCILKNKKADQVNFTDDTGITAFHMACMLSDTSVVENFLRQNININASVNCDSDFCPGYTPLHFATCFNVETVKLLLQKGSSINKNTVGRTPLDLCMERYPPEVIHSILSCKPELKNIVLSDGSTSLLDILLVMNNCDKFNNFLQSSTDVNMSLPHDSPLWPGNTVLHLSILMNEKTKTLDDSYNTSISEANTDTSCNCPEGEELTYWKRIVVCLVRGCSLSSKNADGLTPIHLAFKLHKAHVVDKFLNSCKSDAADPSNLTHFHVACVIGKKSLVERFLSEGADVNSQVRSSFEWHGKPRKFRKTPYLVTVRANSTPLHLAVVFENTEIIELLLQNGADVYAQDALGLTPIHLSIALASNTKSIAQLLLNATPNLKEITTEQGLTHLHVAAFVNDGKVVKKLIEAGSYVDSVFYIQKPKRIFRHEHEYGEFAFLVRIAGATPLYLAIENRSAEAVSALIRGGADIFKIANARAESSFVYALCELNSDHTDRVMRWVKRVFKYDTGAIDESGVTSLHVACGCFDLMWARSLLKRGANVNARVRYEDDEEGGLWDGETPLHVLVHQVNWGNRLPKNVVSFVKLLVKRGADVTIQDADLNTPLHLAYRNFRASKDDVAFFASLQNLLLRKQKYYDVNPTDFRGFSHVHIACVRNNIEIVKKFLDSGIDVNHHVNYFASQNGGFAPLHFAFDCRHLDLARLLIERGANVKAEAIDGNTPLHIAVMKNCMDLELLEMLQRNGADFNAKNLEDMTPLMCLFTLENFTLEQLDFFLKLDCEFDVTHFRSSEGIIGLALKNAASSIDRTLIFEKLVEAGDIFSAIRNGFNAVHSIVSVNQNGILTIKFYAVVIKNFIEIGCDVNQQDEKERTALHDAVYFYNLEAVKVLLAYGADLDIVDNKNQSPLYSPVIANANIKPERKTEMVKILRSYVQKMKFIELNLKDSFEKSMPSSAENKCHENGIVLRCQNELKKMEDAKICDSLTVKSFMYEGVSTYPLMISSERKLVDDYFKNFVKILEEFPIFCSFLNKQYRKAVFVMKRKTLLEVGKGVLKKSISTISLK